MSKESEYKPKSVDIFDMRRGVDKNGKEFRRITFAKGITIQYNGYELDLGQYRSVFLKNKEDLAKSNDVLLEKGFIDADEHARRTDFNEEKQIVGKVNLPVK